MFTIQIDCGNTLCRTLSKSNSNTSTNTVQISVSKFSSNTVLKVICYNLTDWVSNCKTCRWGRVHQEVICIKLWIQILDLLVKFLTTKLIDSWRNTTINTDQVINTILFVVLMFLQSFNSVNKIRGL